MVCGVLTVFLEVVKIEVFFTLDSCEQLILKVV